MLNKKILRSLLVIAVVAIMVVGATVAYFSDSEVSSGNTFTAGTLDLQVNGRDNPGTLVRVEGKPSETIWVGPIEVHNNGTNPGVLDLHFKNVTHAGGANPEPEREYEAANGGVRDDIENALFVDVVVVYENGAQETLIPSYPNPGAVTLGALNSRTLDFSRPIKPSERWKIYLSFHLCPNVGNWGQGDVTKFDIEFTLHQLNAPHTGHKALPIRPNPNVPAPEVPGPEMTYTEYNQWIGEQRTYVDSFFDVFFEIP